MVSKFAITKIELLTDQKKADSQFIQPLESREVIDEMSQSLLPCKTNLQWMRTNITPLVRHLSLMHTQPTSEPIGQTSLKTEETYVDCSTDSFGRWFQTFGYLFVIIEVVNYKVLQWSRQGVVPSGCDGGHNINKRKLPEQLLFL